MGIARHWGFLAFLLALAGWGYSPRATAEIVNCTNITSMPAVITTQGVYCLKQHMPMNLASGAAITVNVNNVTIDCNEFKIGNLEAGTTNNAVGISANGRLNLTVRNCGIRGFRSGVQLVNGDYRVEDNRFDLNTQTGIFVSGDGSAVRRNDVVDTGGSPLAGLTEFHGISVDGDIDIIDNNVSGVASTAGGNGGVYGIRTSGADSGTIRENRIRNLAPDGSGFQRGIWNQDGGHNTVEHNTVVLSAGILGLGDGGIRCGDGLILSGASRDNTVVGTGVAGQVFGLINCTSVAGDWVNPL